jgi:putative RecB family exonuclease
MDRTLLKLSPSSAMNFKSCPQLFKFRSVDRLPEPVSRAQAKGSLVHSVLEKMFTESPEMRTQERAAELLDQLWNEVDEVPEGVVADGTTATPQEIRPTELNAEEEAAWLAESHRLLRNYFRLEDPTQVTASKLEWWVEYELPDIQLRGIIDRLEESPDGSWVLTDYKTGRVPGTQRELAAFFGLRFYALVCWRAFGIIPAQIRLVYLSDPAVLTLDPHERMLVAFEKQIKALGVAIRRAYDNEDWRPSPSPLCMHCSFQAQCPAWPSPEEA